MIWNHFHLDLCRDQELSTLLSLHPIQVKKLGMELATFGVKMNILWILGVKVMDDIQWFLKDMYISHLDTNYALECPL